MWLEQFALLVFLASFLSLATDLLNEHGRFRVARHCHAALLGLLGGVAFFSLVALAFACTDQNSIWTISKHGPRLKNPMTGWMGKTLNLSFQLAPLNGALLGAAGGVLVAHLRRRPRLSI